MKIDEKGALANTVAFISYKSKLSGPKNLFAAEMSTDMSQVGVAFFHSFKNIFYHFTLPGFPFTLTIPPFDTYFFKNPF